MAVLRKRNTKKGFTYDIDFTYRGKRHIVSTKTDDRKIATNILNDIQGKIARGAFNILEYEKKEVEVQQFISEYFDYAEGVKKDRTIVQERHYAKKLLVIVGAKKLIRLIDVQMLDEWRSVTFKKLSPVTYNIERRTLQAIFNVAVKWGYLDENPFCLMPRMSVDEVRRFATTDEIKTILRTISEDISDPNKEQFLRHNLVFRLYVEFLLNTGLRRNEAISLTKENINFETNTLYVQRTKGKKFRLVPMNRRAREIVIGLDESLFSRLKPESVTHKFSDLMVRLRMTHLKLHSLRHTFATDLVSAGVDIYTVKELLGHQDIRTTMVYAKADTETLRRAVERLKN